MLLSLEGLFVALVERLNFRRCGFLGNWLGDTVVGEIARKDLLVCVNELIGHLVDECNLVGFALTQKEPVVG